MSNVLEAWRKGYFSSCIKELDDRHRKIQDKIKEVQNEIQFLNSIPKTRENLLRQRFLAVQSNDKETLQRIEAELKGLISDDEIKEKIRQLETELKRLEYEFENTPFEVAPTTIKPKIEFELDNGGIIKKSTTSEKWYYYPPNSQYASSYHEVVVEKVPKLLRWIRQDSETFGKRLLFEQSLKLEPIEIPIETLVKEVKKQIVKEVPEVLPESIPISLPSKPKCPKCGREYDNLMLARLVCLKCGMMFQDAYEVVKKRRMREEKETKKNRKQLGMV